MGGLRGAKNPTRARFQGKYKTCASRPKKEAEDKRKTEIKQEFEQVKDPKETKKEQKEQNRTACASADAEEQAATSGIAIPQELKNLDFAPQEEESEHSAHAPDYTWAGRLARDTGDITRVLADDFDFERDDEIYQQTTEDGDSDQRARRNPVTERYVRISTIS